MVLAEPGADNTYRLVALATAGMLTTFTSQETDWLVSYPLMHAAYPQGINGPRRTTKLLQYSRYCRRLLSADETCTHARPNMHYPLASIPTPVPFRVPQR